MGKYSSAPMSCLLLAGQCYSYPVWEIHVSTTVSHYSSHDQYQVDRFHAGRMISTAG